MSAELVVAVASHMPYWMPSDACYVPVWVGSSLRSEAAPEGWILDDSYEGNISDKNASYCELTALHWLWRATESPFAGLAHYRRYFSTRKLGAARSRIAGEDDLSKQLAKAPLILPKLRRYYIETNYSQYAHAHHRCDLEVTRQILGELAPEVVGPWDASMKRTYGHRFNMFVARRDILDSWCSFLFPVLAELEQRLDISSYSQNDQRVFGFVAERLIDPWIDARGIPYTEMGVVNLESQKWPRKIVNFVGRKVRGGWRD